MIIQRTEYNLPFAFAIKIFITCPLLSPIKRTVCEYSNFFFRKERITEKKSKNSKSLLKCVCRFFSRFLFLFPKHPLVIIIIIIITSAFSPP